MENINFDRILAAGTELNSSGSTGPAHTVVQTPYKLAAANRVAREAQGIDESSRVLTCCRMSHAGGLLAQTLPAVEIGAEVDIVPFNAYEWVRHIQDGYTHTHLTPLHCEAIMLTKGFQELDLSGLWVTIGADPVHWEVIEAFVARGATVMVNWGMTEVGPIAINGVFSDLSQVAEVRAAAPEGTTYLGDRAWVDVKIRDRVLWVRGDISVHGDTWFRTGDVVSRDDEGRFWYHGREGHPVTAWQNRKG